MIYFCSSLSRDERIWPHSLGTTRFFYKKKKVLQQPLTGSTSSLWIHLKRLWQGQWVGVTKLTVYTQAVSTLHWLLLSFQTLLYSSGVSTHTHFHFTKMHVACGRAPDGHIAARTQLNALACIQPTIMEHIFPPSPRAAHSAFWCVGMCVFES